VSATNGEAERFQRYGQVITLVVARPEFSLAEVKQACPTVKPVFVTRVVRQLETDGYLQREGPKTRPRFCWIRERSEFSPRQWIESKVLNNRLTRAPLSDRPRERLLAHGPALLRIAELLAILVRSGRTGESALQAGEKIAARYSDRIDELADAGRGELKTISPAVADTAYCQIMAGIELGRRIERAAQHPMAQGTVRIRSAADAVAFCQQEFRRLADEGIQEEFRLVCLDSKHQVLGVHLISIGLLNESLVAPREVFRPAIRDAAAAVILVHNHPSGDPTPSPQDLAVTRRLDQVAQTIGIKLLDHVIVARDGCVSIREHEQV
jgi:DNA repair protein RadC